MWDAFVVFYDGFLDKEVKDTYNYKDVVDAALQKQGVQNAGRNWAKELWQELGSRSKNFTDEGRRRKARICKKVRENPSES